MQVEISPALAERAIGDIATSLRGATAVFRKHRLDFCCCGDRHLREAAAQILAPSKANPHRLIAMRKAKPRAKPARSSII